jgi:hypothetical protein
LFTEPNVNEEGNMLTQNLLNISQVTDEFDEELYKKQKDENNGRYKVKDTIISINDSSKNNDALIYQENNKDIKEIKIDNSEIEDESSKLINEKVISKDELEGLNSLEEDIIFMNTNQNFDDVNLLGNELERIKRNQTNNNKVYRKSFIVFLLTLFLCNMLNEYILIKAPFILDKILEDPEKWIIASSFIILLVFSFPLLVFCRIIKKFDIERRLLLIIYLLVFLVLVGIGLYKFFVPDKKIYVLGIIFATFLLSNFLEGITHLLIEKIIPSFAKFCGNNMKYVFSYTTHIGKAFGGINFFCFYFFLFEEEGKKMDYIESIFFGSVTLVFFIISLILLLTILIKII